MDFGDYIGGVEDLKVKGVEGVVYFVKGGCWVDMVVVFNFEFCGYGLVLLGLGKYDKWVGGLSVC